MASKNLSPTGKHAYPLDRIGTHLEIGDTECNNQEQGSTDADGHGNDHASTSSSKWNSTTFDSDFCAWPNARKFTILDSEDGHEVFTENNFIIEFTVRWDLIRTSNSQFRHTRLDQPTTI